ncbi:MAG: right-handed parallel beta-helix repeat-containing protein [Acidobacteriota bacterium]
MNIDVTWLWRALLVIAVGLHSAALGFQAGTEFYVEPDWQGPAQGSASRPWVRLDGAAWQTIDQALAEGPVTVYFSARQTGADRNQATEHALNILRNDPGPHRLLLDGKSRYNSSDSNPSWSSYSGNSRFEIEASYPVSTINNSAPYPPRDYWTLRGFRLIATNGQVIYLGHASHVIIEDNELSHRPSTQHGPGLGVASPGQNFGSSITIRNNVLHDIYGEGIYVAGYYDQAPGFPAGNDLLIEGNLIYDLGRPGGEPDGIDIKDGWTGVVIRGNTVYMSSPNSGRDGIITNSAAVIEENFVYNMGRDGITLTSTYSDHDGFWREAVIRYNVVVGCGANPSYIWGFGIHIPNNSSSYTFIRPKVYNNTVYGTRHQTAGQAVGIGVGQGYGSTVDLYNNIVADSDGFALHAGAGRLSNHRNNLFYAPQGGTLVRYGSNNFGAASIQDFESDALSQNPLFLDTSLPYQMDNFNLRSDSPAAGRDMGAFPSQAPTPSAPGAPTGLREISN